ncbi:sensor histidine kinase [Dinoroseobacter sp. S124A]|uniref:sensor histidine kinase n=1 Tax=Dinoroseobacter sp. S124A TaxID=3415128 RepID=UPI003C7EA6A9
MAVSLLLAPMAQAAELNLSGSHKLMLAADAPGFAEPGYDDSGWQSEVVVALILMVVWSVIALAQDLDHARPLLVGIGALSASILVDLMLPADYFETTFGVRLGELGVLALLLSLFYIFGQRVLRLETAVLRANSDVLTAREQERARIAQDLHDGVGQWLSVVKIKLEVLKAKTPRDPNAANDPLTELVSDMGNALEETRRVAQDLSPVFLDDHGLVGAMRNLASRLALQTRHAITLDAPANLDLPAPVRNHVFRIYQEAMRNALTHSGADQIDVTLSTQGGRCRLVVDDNGCGLDLRRIASARKDAPPGRGLASCGQPAPGEEK